MDLVIFILVIENRKEELISMGRGLIALACLGAFAVVNSCTFSSALIYGEALIDWLWHTPPALIGILAGLIGLGIGLNLLGYSSGFCSLGTGIITAVVLLIVLIWGWIANGECVFLGERGLAVIPAYLLGILFFTLFFSPVTAFFAAVTSVPFAFLGHPSRLAHWGSFGAFLGVGLLGIWLEKLLNHSTWEYLEFTSSMRQWIPLEEDTTLLRQVFSANPSLLFWPGLLLLLGGLAACWAVESFADTENFFE